MRILNWAAAQLGQAVRSFRAELHPDEPEDRQEISCTSAHIERADDGPGTIQAGFRSV